MLKRLYVQFLLWALGPVRAEIARDSPSSETQAANGGWVLREDGGLFLNQELIEGSAIRSSRIDFA